MAKIGSHDQDGAKSQSAHKSQATQQEATHYIAQICGELQELAGEHSLDMIAYLLAMVRQEALETLEDIRLKR